MNQSIATSVQSVATKNQAREKILARLQRFGRVRNRFDLLRGSTTGLVVGLAFIWLIILIDGTKWLADPVRWGLSIIGYGTSLVVAWIFGVGAAVKACLFQLDSESLARDVEASCPHFRESLLASVGLRNADGTIKNGSEVFLSVIEQEAADELRRLSMTSLFPWHELKNKLIVIVVGLATMLSLCFLPSLHFPERLKRAVLPLIDLPSISHLHIVVLNPRNPREFVPAEQYLQFEIRVDSTDVSLDLPQTVSLEWSEPSELEGSGWSNPSLISMIRDVGGDRIYTVSAPVGTKTLRYRILAADARTTYRYIEPIERPKVVEFQWRVAAPAYTRESETSDSQEIFNQSQGDISVLQGSALNLQLAVNQEMRRVAFVWESDEGKNGTIELQKSSLSDPNLLTREFWSAEIPNHGNVRFQVHLTSARDLNGEPVVNSFRPWYNLKWLPDTVPMINWSVTERSLWREPIRASNRTSVSAKSKSNYWVVADSEIVELPCQIIDDYPVVKLEYEISINEEAWKPLHVVNSLESSETTISGKKLVGAVAGYSWDLLPYKLKASDDIQIRAVATDRAGQSGESEILSFSVADSELASDRHARLLLRNQLTAPLRELQIAWNSKRDAIRESIKVLARPDATQDSKTLAAESIREWQSVVEENLNRSEQIATSILPSLSAYIDQYDMELLCRGISRLKLEYLPQLRIALADLQAADQANSRLKPSSFEEWNRRRLQVAEESFTRGSELADQLFELQRDLIGLGLQSALTKDATHVMRLQSKAIEASGDHFKALARTQLIVSKITESMLELVQLIRTDVSKGFSERLDEWCRWLADSRGQISDLVEQTPLDSSNVPSEELKRRINADAEEWKYRRWLFHLDGNLFWNTHSRRKDVDFRAENIDESLNRMISVIEQLRRLDSNKELSSSELGAERSVLQQDLKLAASIWSDQIRVRRELHQTRTIQDQNYPADVGLAKRALEYVLEQYSGTSGQSSDAKQFEQHLRTILKSYRVLDAAHQNADTRNGIERLVESERYDFHSLAAQFDHYLHWDAVSQQIEVAYRKMQRAEFPNGMHDRYNGLRWSGPFSQVNQKLSSRMDPNSADHASATPDLEELLQTWKAYDLKAEPFVEDARNALRKLVPSITELAAEAIAKTKELQDKTQQLSNPSDAQTAPNENKKPTESSKQIEAVAQSERALDQATEKLQEALADEASRQDLLDSDARMQARDSDAALGMIERAQANLEQAMQSLAKPESLTQESIADALKAEKRMETTLQAIQERFNQEQKPSGQPTSLESLAAAKQDGSMSPIGSNDLDPGYEQAEQLDALAKTSKEELLRDLEQQLKSDALMREELEAIAETQQQSLSGELQSLGKSEKDAARELENSDPRMLESKRERAMEMRMLANYADRLGMRGVERAMQLEGSSGQQRSPIDQSTKRDLQNKLVELQQAINQAANLNEQTDAPTLEGASKNLESALQATLNAIKPLGETLKEAADEPITDPKTKKEALKQAENYQKQFEREAKQSGDQLARQWQQEIQNQSQRLEQAERELTQAKRSREQSQKNANQKPNDSWAQEELRRKTVDVDRRTQNVTALEQSIDQLKERSQQLENKSKELRESESTSPSPNPTLGLAAEQIGKAQSLLEAVAEMAKGSSGRSLGDSAANAETLTAATQRQKQINQTVDRIQEELQRNARHQDRMEQTQIEKSLEDYRDQVEQLKNETLAPLQTSLAEAATQTDSIEKKFSQDNREAELSASLEKPSTQNNIAKLNKASDALRSLGESIQNDPRLAPSQSETSTADSPGSPSSSDAAENSGATQNGTSQNSREQMLRSRDRAQLLDRLDRMVFSRGSDSSESSANDSSTRANPLESSLRNAANQIASKMNQQRSQKMQASNQSRSQQSSSNQSKQAASSTGSMSEDQRTNFDSYFLPDRDSESKGDWGKLRKQAAEQNLEGSREAFDPDFDQAIQAYFRTLQAEGAK